MTAWTQDELGTLGAADERQLASRREDGTLRKPVTMWVACHGEDLYVRAFKGRTSPWLRGTQSRRDGHLGVGGIEKQVEFLDPDPSVADALDAEYRSKYGRYGAQYVDPMVSPDARAATRKLLPRPKRRQDATAHISARHARSVGDQSWPHAHRPMNQTDGQHWPADWVRNLQANPRVTVELGDETQVGVTHVLEAGAAEDQRARGLLLAKYVATEDNLDEWGRISLPVMVEFPDNADEPNSCCAEQALSS